MKPQIALPDGCISDLTFDEWSAGELGPARTAALRSHVATCARCEGRRDLLEQQTRGFLARPALDDELLRLRMGLTGPRQGRSRLPLSAAALAAALLLGIFLPPSQPSGDVRSKGAGSVGFYVRRGELIQRGQEGQRVRPGDQLRFTWRSDRAVYLAILSLDAKQTVSTYYPPPGPQRLLGPIGRELELDSAVELDQTLGAERVWVVSCDTPVDVAGLRSSLAATGEPDIRPDCQFERLNLYKEARP